MSTFPEPEAGDFSEEPQRDPAPAEHEAHPADAAFVSYLTPADIESPSHAVELGQSFANFQPAPQPRFPNVLDLVLLLLMLGLGFFCAGAFTTAALHFHLFGVQTLKHALTDIHYTLGSQVVWYCCTFLGCWIVFPLIWRTRFLDGVEWNIDAAFNRSGKLFSAAGACFALAIVDGILIPGPKEAPIDEVFKLPGAAWLLFLFGITLAPFFEEMGFRGFLLPALCTAWDWCVEQLRGLPARERGEEGKVRWSLSAMIVGSLLTSVPFALMHGAQTGYSFGPFILLVCVSLVLCWVRLSTRSVAASTLVHASYNLLLFLMLLIASGGFRHMDKM